MAKKKALSKGREKLNDLADRAKVELEKILKLIGKEADLSSKYLKNRVGIIGIDTEIEKKYLELGKEAYNLVKDGKIADSGLKSVVDEISGLYRKLEQAKAQVSMLKEQIIKAGS